jgi:uroporphyrin-III C-methyltransferase
MNEAGKGAPKPPKLYVVGAGPGDPELLTLKAYKILQQADVVLYDNLANKEILQYVPDSCEKIYVGKLPYDVFTSQETIHELILQKALEKGTVVRLKGGDPYIFGRGYEEVLFAREHGIATSYIPGITSMQAAGLEDIPLTHRNVCESIWVVTGTKKDGSLSEDLTLAIKSKATVVIYMGMKKLKEIAETFVRQGSGDLPAAIIQHASLPKQKMAKGKVQDLERLAAEHQLTHPSIIIIGRVAGIEAGKPVEKG